MQYIHRYQFTAMDTKKNMTDEERQLLAKKLDNDLEKFIEEKKEEAKNSPTLEDDIGADELAEELNNHPAFTQTIDEHNLSPLMEGLQQLKYQSDSKEDNAESFKEDGNRNFKLSKYRWAIENYTAGINERCKSKELNCVLYSNRAAANYRLGNHGSALRDCMAALKFKAGHMKAIVKGAQSLFEIKKYSDCIKWCDDGLTIGTQQTVLRELRQKAVKQKAISERDERKEKAQERIMLMQEKLLINAIKGRGIQIAGGDGSLLASECKVKMDEEKRLHWPVRFIYPETLQSDLIEAFCEDVSLMHQLDVMFEESPPWDTEHKYLPNNLQIMFEEKSKMKLHEIIPSSTLLEALQNKSYVVEGGIPTFIILLRGSLSATEFIAKYS